MLKKELERKIGIPRAKLKLSQWPKDVSVIDRVSVIVCYSIYICLYIKLQNLSRIMLRPYLCCSKYCRCIVGYSMFTCDLIEPKI